MTRSILRTVGCTRFVVAAISLALPGTSAALPGESSISANDYDAWITLRSLEQVTEFDTNSWCALDIYIDESFDELAAGDTVEILVYEDDTIGDDLIFSTMLTATAAEESAGYLDRTVDCSGFFQLDDGPLWGDDQVELYGEAHVDKASCGTFCNEADPATDLLVVPIVADDAFEEDDSIDTAGEVVSGTQERIAADAGDWMTFTLEARSTVLVRLLHDAGAGRVLGRLLDEGGTDVTTFDLLDDATEASAVLDAGRYWIVAQPEYATDPNFYDLMFEVTPAGADGDAGDDGDTEPDGDAFEDADIGADGEDGADVGLDTGEDAADGADDGGGGDAEADGDAGGDSSATEDAGDDSPEADGSDDAEDDADTDAEIPPDDTEGCGCVVAGSDPSGRSALALSFVLGLFVFLGRRPRRR
jgi:hypothetical protein